MQLTLSPTSKRGAERYVLRYVLTGLAGTTGAATPRFLATEREMDGVLFLTWWKSGWKRNYFNCMGDR